MAPYNQFQFLDQRMRDIREVERYYTRTEINEYRSAIERRRESKRDAKVRWVGNREKGKAVAVALRGTEAAGLHPVTSAVLAA